MDLCLGLCAAAFVSAAVWLQLQVWRLGRVRDAYRKGDVALALRRLEQMGPATSTRPMRFVEYVNLYIAGGQYRRAVDEYRRLFPRLSSGLVTHPSGGLILVNISEALGELGEWTESLATVGRVAPRDRHSLTHTGAQVQKAWALQATGHAEHALRIIAAVDPEALRPDYVSEFFFVRCAALLGLGRLDEAAEALVQARQNVTRASAERNALFLEAALHEAQGQLDLALDCYAKGAAHAYQGQGGRALVAWGRLLRKVGRRDEATHAFQRALERDPECESADEARRELAL